MTERPSPEALLAAAQREGRGRLKVFLGAAPGVGKTYAMLRAGHARLEEGLDVLVGVVEAHGRKETLALVDGLEILPRQRIDYRGRTLAEFDLDAALARKPHLILVDELAHSNAPGARHPKRYQDVEELLAAGIDVYTTLNVQHLESLNDVVARITRVRVRETLPDRILEEADEVELVDLTPEALAKRLGEGKVYVEGQAKRAVEHFFKPGNIAALRELALRRVAEQVDDRMVDYMRANAISGPWPAGERLLACIGPDADALAVVRATRRLADQLHAPWTALHVEMPGEVRLPEAARQHLAQAMSLATALGGDTLVIPGTNLPEELLRYAQASNVTQIVLARRPIGLWRRILGRSLVDEVMHSSRHIAVHVVPVDGRSRAGWWHLPPLPRDWRPYALGCAYVVSAGLVAAVLRAAFDLPSLALVFSVGVLGAALRLGLWPAVTAAFLAFLGYNFFFVEPLYTFSVASAQEVLALGVFLVVAVVISGLASQAHDQAEQARARARTTTALFEFSRKLSSTAGLDDLLWAICYQVAATARGHALVLLPRAEQLVVAGSYPPEDDLPPGEQTAARWALEKAEPAGHGTATLPTLAWLFLPLRTARGVVGVLGFRAEAGALDERLLVALADQAAVAVERCLLDREMAEARVLAETEKLRHALLSSISHDLRTPLSAILGAVSSLKGYGEDYRPDVRADLLLTVEEEAQRLNRFVGNLLDMTKLESGALDLRRDWIALADVVDGAVCRVYPRLGGRRIDRALPVDLPLVQADALLLEQVLFNILDNALRYTPPDGTIKIGGHVADGLVHLDVTDTGPGIAPADLERVFDKFYRIRQGDRQGAGTGLGLAICRGIVEAHGGTITAHSPVADGRGTRLALTLPLPPAPPTLAGHG